MQRHDTNIGDYMNPFSVKKSSVSSAPYPIKENVPEIIGSLRISPGNQITHSSFLGATVSKYTAVLPEFLELAISSTSESWGLFKDFDWISASFTAGESDNVVSYKIAQDIPLNGDLSWYVVSADNSAFPTTSDNPVVLNAYDSMYISVVFFGHTNIL